MYTRWVSRGGTVRNVCKRGIGSVFSLVVRAPNLACRVVYSSTRTKYTVTTSPITGEVFGGPTLPVWVVGVVTVIPGTIVMIVQRDRGDRSRVVSYLPHVTLCQFNGMCGLLLTESPAPFPTQWSPYMISLSLVIGQ